MIKVSRKWIATAAIVATLGASLATGTTQASAHDHDWGAPVAAGIIGGLALGALAAGAASPGYYAPPAEYAPPPACWFERRPVYDYYGNFEGYRRIRVCN